MGKSQLSISIFAFITISLNLYKLCHVNASQIFNKGKGKTETHTHTQIGRESLSECAAYVI